MSDKISIDFHSLIVNFRQTGINPDCLKLLPDVTVKSLNV